MRRFSFFFVVFLCFLKLGLAQKIEHKFRFRNLTVSDGLISNQVTSTFQDSKGFLWITQIGGISRYDGLVCKNYEYNNEDSTMLKSPLVSCAIEDGNGNMWFGTLNAGLEHYDRKTEVFTNYSKESKNNPLADNTIRTLALDGNGDVWFGTKLKGFGKIEIQRKKKKLKIRNFPGQQKRRQVVDIFEDSKQRIWISDRSGLRCLKNDGSVLKEKNVFNNKWVRNTFEDSQGNILFVSDEEGLCVLLADSLKKGSFTYSRFQPDEAYLAEGYSDHYKFVLANDTTVIGIRRYDGLFSAIIDVKAKKLKLIQAYRKNLGDVDAPTGNSMRHVFTDRTGVVWISTSNVGALSIDLNKKRFLHIFDRKKEKGIKGLKVEYIFEDHAKNLWLAMEGEPLHFLPKFENERSNYENFSYYGKESGFDLPRAMSIHETQNNGKYSFWVGSWKTFQLKNYLPKKTQNFKFQVHNHTGEEGRIPRGTYWSINQTKDGKIWMGQYGNGFIRFDLDDKQDIINIEHYKYNKNDSNGLSDNTVRCFKQTRDGAIWVGTGSGLNKVVQTPNADKPLSFKVYKKKKDDPNSLSYNYIIQIYEDKNGMMWLASLGGGLIKAIRNENGDIVKFKNYSQKDGFPDKMVKGILEDDAGNLWLSTEANIARFNIKDEKFRIYTQEDGLQGSGFADNSCYRRTNGQMIFGGFNGLNVFHPDSINDNAFMPQVSLTDFKVYGKTIKANEIVNDHVVMKQSIETADTVVVSYKENVIEFHFASMHYAVPLRNKLKYKLEGFDNEWMTSPKGRNFASYTNLDGGTYIFKVMGSNNDDYWNPEAQSITLIVLPPWWKTVWFRILLLSLVIALSIGLYIYRVRSIKADNERLEKLVALRTESLRNANASLIEQKEEISSQKEEIQQQTEELKVINEQVSYKNSTLEEQKATLIKQKDTISKAYENIKLLGEFGQDITSVLDVQDVSKMMSQYIQHFMETDSHGIGLLSPKRGEIVFRNYVQNGNVRNVFVCKLSDQYCLASRCMVEGKEIFTGDIAEDYFEYIEGSPEIDSMLPPRAVIYLPLVEKKEMVGVLVVQHKSPNAYSEQQQNLLRNLASYLSVAIANAKSYQVIKQKNTDIGQSLVYAQTIQQAILPLRHRIQISYDYFSIFKPKDVVSGDFYWYTEIKQIGKPDIRLLAVIDCTGHGVPGAIMSIVSNGALNRIVNERKVYEPAQILENLDIEIRNILKQEMSGNKDGMDVCLCRFSTMENGNEELFFSASKRPLYVFRSRNEKLDVIKGTRRYIGGIQSNFQEPFRTERFELVSGDVVYLSSDGFVDQNGKDRTRYGSRKLINVLQKIGHLNIEEQEKVLLSEFEKHMQNEEQRDDVTLVGLKIKG